jgi:hypothetical protein
MVWLVDDKTTADLKKPWVIGSTTDWCGSIYDLPYESTTDWCGSIYDLPYESTTD